MLPRSYAGRRSLGRNRDPCSSKLRQSDRGRWGRTVGPDLAPRCRSQKSRATRRSRNWAACGHRTGRSTLARRSEGAAATPGKAQFSQAPCGHKCIRARRSQVLHMPLPPQGRMSVNGSKKLPRGGALPSSGFAKGVSFFLPGVGQISTEPSHPLGFLELPDASPAAATALPSTCALQRSCDSSDRDLFVTSPARIH